MRNLKLINITSIKTKPISLQKGLRETIYTNLEIIRVNRYLKRLERKINLHAFLNSYKKISYVKIVGYEHQPIITNDLVKAKYNRTLKHHGLTIDNDHYLVKSRLFSDYLTKASTVTYSISKDKSKQKRIGTMH